MAKASACSTTLRSRFVRCVHGTLIRRAAIVDCDVHQGNGTATIFAGDKDTFTFSMHGANNYPLFKAQSTLDVELPDGTSDDAYLETLARHLPAVFAHDPDIVFYLAGADPFAGTNSAGSRFRSTDCASVTLMCCVSVMNAKFRS